MLACTSKIFIILFMNGLKAVKDKRFLLPRKYILTIELQLFLSYLSYIKASVVRYLLNGV